MDFIIVYANLERDTLKVVEEFSYEFDSWDRASRQIFRYREEAENYMKQLAEDNGLNYESDKLRFLD